MNKQHQTITLDTDNGHTPEIIERFNRVAKQYDLTELPILLQSWMDDQDIADFAGMLEERLVLSATPVTISTLPPALRCVVVEHNIVVTATGEALPAKVCDGGLWGDDFDNLASSKPEDPYIYKDVEGKTLPPEPYGRPVTFTQVFLRTTKTNEQLLQEYK